MLHNQVYVFLLRALPCLSAACVAGCRQSAVQQQECSQACRTCRGTARSAAARRAAPPSQSTHQCSRPGCTALRCRPPSCRRQTPAGLHCLLATARHSCGLCTRTARHAGAVCPAISQVSSSQGQLKAFGMLLQRFCTAQLERAGWQLHYTHDTSLMISLLMQHAVTRDGMSKAAQRRCRRMAAPAQRLRACLRACS